MGVEMFDNKVMKTISEYMAATRPDRTPKEWAEFFGISRSHLVMIANGTAQPSKALMQRIEDRTNGGVPILSWFERQGNAA